MQRKPRAVKILFDHLEANSPPPRKKCQEPGRFSPRVGTRSRRTSPTQWRSIVAPKSLKVSEATPILSFMARLSSTSRRSGHLSAKDEIDSTVQSIRSYIPGSRSYVRLEQSKRIRLAISPLFC